MSPDQLQTVRRLHHEVGLLPRSRLVPVAAGDVVTLLNVIRSEELRADVAEERLKAMLVKAAEENLEELLIGDNDVRRHRENMGPASTGTPAGIQVAAGDNTCPPTEERRANGRPAAATAS